MAIGSFVSVGRSLSDAIPRVRPAQELGYDAAYVTHIAGRDSLTVLAAYAAATSRIGLGTGVVPIYTRSPATMAMTAATLQLRGGHRRLRRGRRARRRPGDAGGHLGALPARAVRDRLAPGGPCGPGAIPGRGRHRAVRGTDRADRLRGDVAGGGARLRASLPRLRRHAALTASPREGSWGVVRGARRRPRSCAAWFSKLASFATVPEDAGGWARLGGTLSPHYAPPPRAPPPRTPLSPPTSLAPSPR